MEGLPIRILHVVGRMNRGGVETWLLNVIRNVSPAVVRSDIMVHDEREGAYDAELAALGVKIHRNTAVKSPIQYYRRLREIVGRPPRYLGIHSHVHHFSGFVLTFAASLGVPVRIAHSHSDTQRTDGTAPVIRGMYLRSMEWLLTHNATMGFACSEPAAAALFGADWRRDGRWELLHCGIDPDAFSCDPQREQVRAEFHLPSDAEVVVHVGRFDYPKNHHFLVDILMRLAAIRPSAYLMLVGDGVLRSQIEEYVGQQRLDNRVRFCGVRPDVPRLLRAADVFVFPSHYEGLPVACLEAQAAGLPLVVSDQITPEIVVDPDQVSVLPLRSAEEWARAIDARLQISTPRRPTVNTIRGSRFDISHSAAALIDAYRTSAGL
jgi:glycosyltransferase involved in cell wall biosynthesis